MGLIGGFVCDRCGYRSRPILLGAFGEPYDLALGQCVDCREIVAYDPDLSHCSRCGHSLIRLVQDELGSVGCPCCGSPAELLLF